MRRGRGFDEDHAVVDHQDGGCAVAGDAGDRLVGGGSIQSFLKFLVKGVPVRHGAAAGGDVEAPEIR